MPGITALSNPNDKSKLLVFYDNKKLSPAISVLSADGSADQSQLYDSTSNTAAQDGPVVNPSALASLFTENLVTVLGITKPATTTASTGTCSCSDCSCGCNSSKGDTYNISVLSPVYAPLEQTEAGNASLAMCKSDDTTYVYYLTGTDKSKRTVIERTLKIASTFNSENDPSIADCVAGSKLAAYYDSDEKKRFLIYQGNEDGNDFYEYDIQGKSDTDIDTSKVTKYAAFTAVYVSKSKKTYLYYIDKDYKIRRIIKSSGTWGDSSSFSDNEADQSSHIAAVYSPDYDLVHVLFFSKNSMTINHLKDNVKST